MKDGDYEEDTFDIDINKENMNMVDVATLFQHGSCIWNGLVHDTG